MSKTLEAICASGVLWKHYLEIFCIMPSMRQRRKCRTKMFGYRVGVITIYQQTDRFGDLFKIRNNLGFVSSEGFVWSKFEV